jgi:hypothetical protein
MPNDTIKGTVRWAVVSIFFVVNLLLAVPAQSVEWNNAWCLVEDEWVECCIHCYGEQCVCDFLP